ncbi:MAG TPA: NAD(P)/FAD-dependent oxidoreductase [Anaerolineaceae bacterium]
MQLINGSRIVIVGGGPAGSFTALHLLVLSAEAHLNLDVIIIEARDFNRPGPGSCNKCAGILSTNLVQNMEKLGLRLPTEVIQSVIDSYILHIGGAQLPLHALNASRRTVSVYRGGGPRLGGLPMPLSFDGWLLHQAQERGARIIRKRVQTIRSGPRPIVVTAHEEFEADLVVMATGVNSRSILDPSWGYQPPRTEIMAQDEIPLPGGMSDNSVHIFFENPPGLIFGALIPKGRYANISLLGHGLPSNAVNKFFDAHGLKALIPEGSTFLCGCTPHVAISTAAGFFADRLVVVGDAAVTRLYKDGIGSAFITAEAAAQTAILLGISQEDFSIGYKPVCLRIAADNSYGRLLFRLWYLTFHTPILRKTWTQAIINEINQIVDNHIFTRVLWGMFTGDESYRLLFWMTISMPAMVNFLLAALKIRGKR